MSDKKRKSQVKEDTNAPKRSKQSPEKSATKKPLLSGKEHEDLKRFLRERKKFLVRQPHFQLTAVGRRACAASTTAEKSSSEAILASDVKLLLLYLMMGDKMQDAEIGSVASLGSIRLTFRKSF